MRLEISDDGTFVFLVQNFDTVKRLKLCVWHVDDLEPRMAEADVDLRMQTHLKDIHLVDLNVVSDPENPRGAYFFRARYNDSLHAHSRVSLKGEDSEEAREERKKDDKDI